MVKDAEENAEADKKRRELIEAKNQAESMIHQTEKSISDLGDTVPADEKEKAESAITDLKTALEGDDVEDIKAKTDALMQASMAIGELAYRKAQEEASGTDDAAADSGEAKADEGKSDDVVDADFTEVDDDDNQKSA